LQSTLSKLCSYTHQILNIVQENVKNCKLISHFTSGLCWHWDYASSRPASIPMLL